ncbi:SiaB family protein kinase [Marinibaculum pumilum]|uniref:SiaB family protein kinase n=1 Tax=Marinibaculum pumilum TaxID=1766165 RepID=A0ABV7KUE9_9PROT
MQQDTILKLREIFERCQIILSFNGPFSQSLIEELGQAIRHYLEAQAQARKSVSDVFAVYIELTQNIRHYADSAPVDEAQRARLNAGTVHIAREGDSFLVVSGNHIRREDAPPLVAHLDRLAAMDAKELRRAYKEKLREPVPEGATGAGLGLLQIARLATAPLEHAMAELDDGHLYFTLTVRL